VCTGAPVHYDQIVRARVFRPCMTETDPEYQNMLGTAVLRGPIPSTLGNWGVNHTGLLVRGFNNSRRH